MNVDQPFEVSIERLDDGATRLVVAGEIDLETAPRLRQALHDAVAAGTGSVVVDLGQVTFLDSTGLNSLLGARAALVREGRGMLVEHASTRVQRVFEVTGVAELFDEGGPDGSGAEPPG